MARGKKSKVQKHQSESDSESEQDASPAPAQQQPVAPAAVTSEQADASSDSGSESGNDSDAGLSKAELKKKKKEQMRAEKAQKGKKGKKAKDEASAPAKDKAEESDKDGEDGSAGEQSGEDGDSEDDEPVVVTRQEPIQVLYCPLCTFPAEMCEFSGMMEKCRPWLQEHAADLADAEERGRKRRILTDKERLEAMVEGRGIKKAIERVVVMELEKRTGKRMITSVFGMDLFGHNLKDLSKEWRKTFSCGAGVRSPEEGKHQECIDIQGNVVDQLAEMMVKKYNIPKGAIYKLEKKKKVPYF